VRGPRWWVLALLLGLAAVPRVIGLDQDFWIDETATAVTYLRLPWWKAVQTYHSANQHLLYSALGSLSFAVFGESEAAARLPAVVFGSWAWERSTCWAGVSRRSGRRSAPQSSSPSRTTTSGSPRARVDTPA
jgi:hypothetical protein